MPDFGSTDERLRRIEGRMPEFLLAPMRVVRMTYHLQRHFRDRTNAALKKYDLADPAYMVLAILYGSAGETSTASELADACHEKPANLTRVCDELAARGLIERKPKPDDRRAVMISLSEYGRRVIEQALPDVTASVSPAFDVLTPAELNQLESLCLRLIGGADR